MPKIRYDEGHPVKDYDAALGVLEALTPHYGYCWSDAAIAEACGISRQMVRYTVQRALRKAQVRLAHTELRAELQEMLRRA